MSHFLKMSTAAHDILNLKKLHVYHLDLWQTDYIRYFEGITPPNWEITDVQCDAIPMGYLLIPGEQPGIMMTFNGPRIVKLTHGQREGREGFSVWFMPLPYQGKPTNIVTKWPAQLLGLAPQHAVYGYQHSWEVPTWPRWQEEFVKILRLQPPPPGADEET